MDVLNIKVSWVENKIPVTEFVNKVDYDNKTKEIERKYFTNADYNKLVTESDISNLGKKSDLNTKLSTLATKAELKAENL